MKIQIKLLITIVGIGLIIFLFEYRNSFIFNNPLSLNGENCATIEYYNPDTDKHSTYTLKVNVEENRVTDIYWENGGVLNEKHFKDYAFLEDGITSFKDDRGREFIIYLTDKDWCD